MKNPGLLSVMEVVPAVAKAAETVTNTPTAEYQETLESLQNTCRLLTLCLLIVTALFVVWSVHESCARRRLEKKVQKMQWAMELRKGSETDRNKEQDNKKNDPVEGEIWQRLKQNIKSVLPKGSKGGPDSETTKNPQKDTRKDPYQDLPETSPEDQTWIQIPEVSLDPCWDPPREKNPVKEQTVPLQKSILPKTMSPKPMSGRKEEASVLAGMELKKSTKYNNQIIRLKEIPVKDATFLLYADGSVKPIDRQFQSPNKGWYYQKHHFGQLFDLEDVNGHEVVLVQGNTLKCLQLLEPAIVKKEQDKGDYLLEKKGILLVEEQ